MPKITVTLEPEVALFYNRVALSSGQNLERVLSDTLFKLAGELSLEALLVNNPLQDSAESH